MPFTSYPSSLAWLSDSFCQASRACLTVSCPAQARYEMSPAELEMYRIASGIATKAMRALLEKLRPGLRELEVAAEADRLMKESGAYNYGFDTMVCSGPRINTIIGRSTNRVIREGELVMLGVSPRYEGYTTALGRTVVAGRASTEQREFLDHGIEGYERAAKEFRLDGPALWTRLHATI